jgi:hypothetical protein
MKRQWTRYAFVALFACLLGVLAHASISRAVQGRDPAPGAAKGTRLAGQDADARRDDQKLQNTLLQKLWDMIDQADDLSSEEKSEAFDILEEADPILARIKKENEKAIEILRNPPRMVMPKRPAKKDAEPPKDAAKPGEADKAVQPETAPSPDAQQ